MLSDVTTLASLVQQTPALVVGILGLLFGGWSYRQGRRAIAAAEARLGVSAVRQGKRLGAAENALGLLDMRRRITEDELLDAGIRLSYWPPDGPDQRRPADAEGQAHDVTDTEFAPTIPPLPERLSRHRR